MEAIKKHFAIPSDTLESIVSSLKGRFPPRSLNSRIIFQARFPHKLCNVMKPAGPDSYHIPEEQQGLQLGDDYFFGLTLTVRNKQDIVNINIDAFGSRAFLSEYGIKEVFSATRVTISENCTRSEKD